VQQWRKGCSARSAGKLNLVGLLMATKF